MSPLYVTFPPEAEINGYTLGVYAFLTRHQSKKTGVPIEVMQNALQFPLDEIERAVRVLVQAHVIQHAQNGFKTGKATEKSASTLYVMYALVANAFQGTTNQDELVGGAKRHLRTYKDMFKGQGISIAIWFEFLLLLFEERYKLGDKALIHWHLTNKTIPKAYTLHDWYLKKRRSITEDIEDERILQVLKSLHIPCTQDNLHKLYI